jgi:hypothetical protein
MAYFKRFNTGDGSGKPAHVWADDAAKDSSPEFIQASDKFY